MPTNPQLIRKNQMTMLGVSELANSRVDVPALWKRFEQIQPRIYHAVSQSRYVIITWGPETELSNKHFIFTGVEVQKLEAPPVSAVIKILPAAQYAVFTGWIREFDELWNYAMNDWLVESQYDMPGFVIQVYDAYRYFRSNQSKREIDLMIPLRKKVKQE